MNDMRRFLKLNSAVNSTLRRFVLICMGVFIFLGCVSSLEAGRKKAKGRVFEDLNRNGVFDKGEPGIAGVVVSNQYDVVQTNKKGNFKIPIGKESIIFVTKPAGYDVPLDKNNIPRFYYIHQPKGSPGGLKYEGIAPTGKLPKRLCFPLVKCPVDETFSVIVMGDPQTRSPKEIDFFRDDIVAQLPEKGARFYIALGDIMYDDLSHYDAMNAVVGSIGIPVRHVMGNHDMNFRVPGNHYEAETFKRVYGPDYYSFNHGKVHFVVLNTVNYLGWNREKEEKGPYCGYIHERQLTWLKNDLAVVPDDFLVVLAMHIPLDSDIYEKDHARVTNRDVLFKLLEKRRHLVALAGHMHYFDYLDLSEGNGWHGEASFPLISTGAACGSWWEGPRDPRGIPFGMCTDGIPNGYFIFTFTGNRYNYRFEAPAASPDGQFRINSPRGTISAADAAEAGINVNVFAGTPHTKVTFCLDDGAETVLKRVTMKDPYYAGVVEANRGKYRDWIEASPCNHIWEGVLPVNLKPGIHRLKVTVHDHQGNRFTGHRLFRITPPESRTTPE